MKFETAVRSMRSLLAAPATKPSITSFPSSAPITNRSLPVPPSSVSSPAPPSSMSSPRPPDRILAESLPIRISSPSPAKAFSIIAVLSRVTVWPSIVLSPDTKVKSAVDAKLGASLSSAGASFCTLSSVSNIWGSQSPRMSPTRPSATFDKLPPSPAILSAKTSSPPISVLPFSGSGPRIAKYVEETNTAEYVKEYAAVPLVAAGAPAASVARLSTLSVVTADALIASMPSSSAKSRRDAFATLENSSV